LNEDQANRNNTSSERNVRVVPTLEKEKTGNNNFCDGALGTRYIRMYWN